MNVAPSQPPPFVGAVAESALVVAVRRVRRYLRFLGCARDAVDDLVQETMLAALGRWPHDVAPLPWLLATARNLHRHRLRALGRRRELHDVDRLHRLWVDAVDDDGGDARRDALRACLQELPSRSRTVLDLRYGEQLDRAAIASRIGLREEGVKSLLARMRAALAACVGRRLRDE